ncbi:MAG: nucleoside deaminase [Bacilli bacterium]|nr:nucleoside deaminase [Bacilli bacterium]
MNQLIYDELNKLVDKAIKKDEVPVAALIVKEGKIIAKAYNKTNTSNNVLDHAEIICINKASKRLHNWRLIDCELYVTLEPCSMCKEVIRKSRIGNIYYIISQNEHETEKNPEYIKLDDDKNIQNKLVEFFKQKR